jgi:hypothetical protein
VKTTIEPTEDQTHMSGGRFLLILAVTAWAGGLTRAQEAPPVRSNTSTNAPTVGTNATQELLAAARQEAKIKALKEFGVIVRKDPFRLNPPPKVEKPAEIEELVPVAPQLQGISTLYSPPKALLRISKAGGGKAMSVFLESGEEKGGVEVISVDVATSTVVVKVSENTYDLKIEKPKFVSKPTTARGSRFPPRGSSGSRLGGSSGSRLGGSQPSTPPRKPGGLKPVPTRQDITHEHGGA